MIDENLAAMFGMPEITVVTGYDITCELADKCFDKGGSLYYAGIPTDAKLHTNKIYALPDFCFFFIHKATGNPVGYFVILPLTEDSIMRYMDNKLLYNTIEPDDLQPIKSDQMYNLFFDSIVLCKQYRTSNMARLFLRCLRAILSTVRKSNRFAIIS